MRCIEISILDNSFTLREWLIETWDVLKLPSPTFQQNKNYD